MRVFCKAQWPAADHQCAQKKERRRLKDDYHLMCNVYPLLRERVRSMTLVRLCQIVAGIDVVIMQERVIGDGAVKCRSSEANGMEPKGDKSVGAKAGSYLGDCEDGVDGDAVFVTKNDVIIHGFNNVCKKLEREKLEMKVSLDEVLLVKTIFKLALEEIGQQRGLDSAEWREKVSFLKEKIAKGNSISSLTPTLEAILSMSNKIVKSLIEDMSEHVACLHVLTKTVFVLDMEFLDTETRRIQ